MGNVKSFMQDKENGRLMTPQYTKKGYLKIGLYKDGVFNMKRVHRLVAQAFVPNPDNKPQVNHINEVKDDNRAENLNWMTNKENNKYGTKLQRQSETWRKKRERQ